MTQRLRPQVHVATGFLYQRVTADDNDDNRDGVKMALMKTPLKNSRKLVMMALSESENNGDNGIIFTTISCQCQSRVGVRSQSVETRSREPAQIALTGIPGKHRDNTEIITQIIRHNCTITLHL